MKVEYMTLRELVESVCENVEGADSLVIEVRRRLPEIEAAVADSDADLLLEDLGKLPRTSDYRDAYRTARDARRKE